MVCCILKVSKQQIIAGNNCSNMQNISNKMKSQMPSVQMHLNLKKNNNNKKNARHLQSRHSTVCPHYSAIVCPRSGQSFSLVRPQWALKCHRGTGAAAEGWGVLVIHQKGGIIIMQLHNKSVSVENEPKQSVNRKCVFKTKLCLAFLKSLFKDWKNEIKQFYYWLTHLAFIYLLSEVWWFAHLRLKLYLLSPHHADVWHQENT